MKIPKRRCDRQDRPCPDCGESTWSYSTRMLSVGRVTDRKCPNGHRSVWDQETGKAIPRILLRAMMGHPKKWSHCKRGHPLTAENRRGGVGQCRLCQNARVRRLQVKLRKEGLCQQCRRPRDGRFAVYCQDCGLAHRKLAREWFRRKNAMERL